MKITVEFDQHANCFWFSPNNKYILAMVMAKRYLIMGRSINGIFLIKTM